MAAAGAILLALEEVLGKDPLNGRSDAAVQAARAEAVGDTLEVDSTRLQAFWERAQQSS